MSCNDRVAFDWAATTARLQEDARRPPSSCKHGAAPKPGDLHVQPELAATLRVIASRGRDGFYAGAVAEDIVSCLRTQGGLHTLEDFAETRGDYVTPVSSLYHGFDIHQMPPNNQGLTRC
jgi:gamma-glutamyltranspeptidase/glutathione hydrolase